MRTLLKSIEGPETSIDLTEVALIQQYGQRTSAAGWVNVKMTLKSGAIIEVKMTPEDYDQLLIDWNATTP